ncbi:hypothetical protein ES677_00425 [Bizionia gelidisalsuginis]|uniref:Uncharacterized protein n=1 Tax=Bizionia gelidisalsuginis TaxID=291188 RepID=A0ABY3MEA3_9FLAO|nr:hypothetical protein [Bizionia gelidisalsuginis]TYC17876.1 hypothetical protein ES677_00425 [Bizionia gelidisalsuginis]
MNLELLLLVGLGAFSAIVTFILHTKYKQNTVRASALVGLFSSLVVLIFPDALSAYHIKNIPLVAFGASFIGMVSSSVLSNYFLLACSGSVFTFVFLKANSVFSGFGGGLGVAACISLLVVLALPVIFKKAIRSIVWLHVRKSVTKFKD